MTTPTHISRRSVLKGTAGIGAGIGAAGLLAACGDDDKKSNANEPMTGTIDWWNIGITEPGLSINAKYASDFEAAHAGVKINNTKQENEAFKAKLLTVTQAGNPPSLFHSWGGGVLQQQTQAGLTKEITDKQFLSTMNKNGNELYKVDGKQYGVAFDLGMVGFWYNKDLFAKAGVNSPPKTWNEFIDVVKKLKTAGVVPLALAGAEKWPGHFYWSYLVIRQVGVSGLQAAVKNAAFDSPEIVAASQKLKDLADLQPFQTGFLGAKYSAADGQAAFMGNGQTAMELMGQWAPSTQIAYSTSKAGIGDKLGFFTFPEVEGGKGKADEAFGGGNGYAVGKDAPKVTFEFLKFILNVENQRTLAASGSIIPVTAGAEDALKDANLKAVYAAVSKASAFQLYLDQAYPPALGGQVNDSVAELIAGKTTPQKLGETISKTAKTL